MPCTRSAQDWSRFFFLFFFFNDTATTEIYTLSLHDALPICSQPRNLYRQRRQAVYPAAAIGCRHAAFHPRDRKSTRLNSSHVEISYAVFCLKKKTKKYTNPSLLKTNKKKQNQ